MIKLLIAMVYIKKMINVYQFKSSKSVQYGGASELYFNNSEILNTSFLSTNLSLIYLCSMLDINV